MKTDKNQYIKTLRKALDITLAPDQRIPQLYKEKKGDNGLYLLCSSEEKAGKPFLRVTYSFEAVDGVRLQGRELTLEEAAGYLKEKRANPLRVEERIKKAKGFLEKKIKN